DVVGDAAAHRRYSLEKMGKEIMDEHVTVRESPGLQAHAGFGFDDHLILGQVADVLLDRSLRRAPCNRSGPSEKTWRIRIRKALQLGNPSIKLPQGGDLYVGAPIWPGRMHPKAQFGIKARSTTLGENACDADQDGVLAGRRIPIDAFPNQADLKRRV